MVGLELLSPNVALLVCRGHAKSPARESQVVREATSAKLVEAHCALKELAEVCRHQGQPLVSVQYFVADFKGF